MYRQLSCLSLVICSAAALACNDGADTDEDGLCDVWETSGIRLQDGTLVARDDVFDLDGDRRLSPHEEPDPSVKDLYVELDAMRGLAVRSRALNTVATAFANAPLEHGIRLHVQTGEIIPRSATIDFAPDLRDAPDHASGFRSIKTEFFGSAAARARADWPSVQEARRMVFRYALAADEVRTREGTPDGTAEQQGDDFVVAVGTLHRKQRAKSVMIRAGRRAPLPVFDADSMEAAAFMHELGHTLGLDHGGGDAVNCKPNYLSVMNYLYVHYASLAAGSTRDALGRAVVVPVDYSHEKLADLDEKALRENLTLSDIASGAGWNAWLRGRAIVFPNLAVVEAPKPHFAPAADARGIDWNLDGDFDDVVEQDLNALEGTLVAACRAPAGGAPSSEKLTSFDDWRAVARGLAVREWGVR